jgi:hypothetical protein
MRYHSVACGTASQTQLAVAHVRFLVVGRLMGESVAHDAQTAYRNARRLSCRSRVVEARFHRLSDLA